MNENRWEVDFVGNSSQQFHGLIGSVQLFNPKDIHVHQSSWIYQFEQFLACVLYLLIESNPVKGNITLYLDLFSAEVSVEISSEATVAKMLWLFLVAREAGFGEEVADSWRCWLKEEVVEQSCECDVQGKGEDYPSWCR